MSFRPHKGGKAHHSKLIHLKHNAALEREAAGIFPAPPSQRDQLQRLPVGAKADLLRRHMKAGLFDQEDAGAPMGTHFVTSPDHPQYVRGEEVASPTDQSREQEEQAEEARAETRAQQQVVRAGRAQHDLSESVTPRAAMGTHFISSPERPDEQERGRGVRQEDKDNTPQMGTHFLTSPDHPAQQFVTDRAAAEGERPTNSGSVAGVRDAGGMGTHFISSPEHPEAQAPQVRGVAPVEATGSAGTTITHEPRDAGEKIGRASCRERV